MRTSPKLENPTSMVNMINTVLEKDASPFIWAEYAIGGVHNRNDIRRIDSSEIPPGMQECYRSIFLFDDGLKRHVEAKGTVKGYPGAHTADYLYFDFDGADLIAVRQSVIKFSDALSETYDLAASLINISFSGSKGFHVAIPMELFGKIPPGPEYYKVYKGLANAMTLGHPYIDGAIYERRRLMRIMNTRHGESSLFKIPLTPEELRGLEVTEIKDLARQPRPMSTNPPITGPVHALAELYERLTQKAVLEVAHDHFSLPAPGKTMLLDLLDGVPDGERNRSAMVLAGIFISKNFDHAVTSKLLRQWNGLNQHPLPMHELDALCEQAYRRYGNAGPQMEHEGLTSQILDMEQLLKAYTAGVHSRQTTRVNIGVPRIDDKIRGVSPGETCAILGHTGVGKSVLLQNIGIQNATRSGVPVLFFSLEMPRMTIFERMVQMILGIPGSEVEHAIVNDDERILDKIREMIPSLENFHVIDHGGMTLNKIRRAICYGEDHVYQQKTGLVLVDYLGLIHGPGDSVYDRVSSVGRGIKELAKDLAIPIISLSQVNRKYSEFNRLELGAARDSGAVDEASDFVLGLWRSKKSDQAESRWLTLGLLKNRKGGIVETPVLMNRKTLLITPVVGSPLTQMEGSAYGGGGEATVKRDTENVQSLPPGSSNAVAGDTISSAA